MFEAAELGRSISKKEFLAQVPQLRADLLQAQAELKERNIPVIVMISGAEGAGKGELVHRLNAWLDPRTVDTVSLWKRSDEEEERPYYWRFWRVMPGRGRMAIFYGSWYSRPIVDRVYGQIDTSQLDSAMERITSFERMLVDGGMAIVKFWFHLSKRDQGKALKDQEKNPVTRWRLHPIDWEHYKHYHQFVKVSERALRHTNHEFAPWHIVEAVDRYYRELTTGQILLETLQRRLASGKEKSAPSASPPPPAPAKKTKSKKPEPTVTILDQVDLTKCYSDNEYKLRLEKYQGTLTRLAWQAHERGISQIALFEGWDAAGKGSAIRRVTEAMDPRMYRVIPIAAPTDEERAHHYLWRFWRHLPRAGTVTMYDRSWYGRVLVERIERFAQEQEWQRAYEEINSFEEQLTEHGIILLKFWVHISKDEQLRRFEARKQVDFKKYKITEEDWRNRDKWDEYQLAVHDMVNYTSTANAPWILVPGNDKKYARITIVKSFCDALEKVL